VKAIDTLMAEHRVIEQMLTVLERLADRLDRAGDLPVRLLEDMVDLLAQYSDALHHTKEERRLFQVVIERGIEPEGGPVSTLLDHHDSGRSQLQDLRGELHPLKLGDRTAFAACAAGAHDYAEFLRDHIRMEDEDVFPLIAKAMSDEEDGAMAIYFAEVDEARHTADLLARFEQIRVRCAEVDELPARDST